MKFFEKISGVKKVLVLDLGFLGDTVTLIPALSLIRRGLPGVEMHVMVEEKVVPLMALTPWIDRALGYPRFPKGPKWYQDFGRIAQLRLERYDAIINLNGSDRSAILTGLSGAKYRLGRIPPRKKIPFFWKCCFTDTVWVPFGTMHMSLQRIECLEKVGFPKKAFEFDTEVPEKLVAKVRSLLPKRVSFLHISPFTTLDYKEMRIPLLAKVINSLKKPFVLSCAPNEREKEKLRQLKALLEVEALAIFDGTLTVLELSALISQSCGHIGGDSGALHLANMAGVPTFSWFRKYRGSIEWAPCGKGDVQVVGEKTPNGLVLEEKVVLDELSRWVKNCS